jgi:hypothetical protein
MDSNEMMGIESSNKLITFFISPLLFLVEAFFKAFLPIDLPTNTLMSIYSSKAMPVSTNCI